MGNNIKGFLLLKNIYLTKRQLEVLGCVLSGHSAKQAAINLGISNRTVEKYVEMLKEKLHCRRTSEIVALCIKYQLVSAIFNGLNKNTLETHLPDLL